MKIPLLESQQLESMVKPHLNAFVDGRCNDLRNGARGRPQFHPQAFHRELGPSRTTATDSVRARWLLAA